MGAIPLFERRLIERTVASKLSLFDPRRVASGRVKNILRRVGDLSFSVDWTKVGDREAFIAAYSKAVARELKGISAKEVEKAVYASAKKKSRGAWKKTPTKWAMPEERERIMTSQWAESAVLLEKVRDGLEDGPITEMGYNSGKEYPSAPSKGKKAGLSGAVLTGPKKKGVGYSIGKLGKMSEATTGFAHTVAEVLSEWDDEDDPRFVKLATGFDAFMSGLDESTLVAMGFQLDEDEDDDDEDSDDDSEDD